MLDLRRSAQGAMLMSGVLLGALPLGTNEATAQSIACANWGNVSLTTTPTYIAVSAANCGTINISNSYNGTLDGPNNAASVSVSSSGYIYELNNFSSNTNVPSSYFIYNSSSGTINVIENYGFMGGSVAAIRNNAWGGQTTTINSIVNKQFATIGSAGGLPTNPLYGIYNVGLGGTAVIHEIQNFGTIAGTAAGIGNDGRIVTFHNATPVTILANLPETYRVIIRGPNDFGRLTWVSGAMNSTIMRFGISSYSTALAAGTYAGVLANITSGMIDSRDRSGTSGSFAWQLEDPDQDNSWDLILTAIQQQAPPPSAPAGPDAANTWLALQSNSGVVQSVLSQRAATTTFALDYDCSVFDVHGFCVSAGFRNSQIGSEYADSGETAGLLTAAYRVTPEFRIGGFIDQNLVSQSPVGVDPKNTQPMLGAFAVYQENQDFSGLTIRGAVAYQEGDLRITRPELENTEAGTGRTRTSALAFGGEIAYGVALDGTWVAQPYAGMRRSDSQRRGYTETASDSVEFPITYNRLGQQVTSATAGLRLRGAITPEFSLTFGAGMEHDLDSKVDRYAGTSTISGLETFSINASQQQNETRAVGSAGMRYMVASNQALAFDASVRQLPYGNDPSVTTMLRYSIGF